MYSGNYWKRAAQVRARANANPDTRCAAPNCGRTLAEHPPTTTGKPPRWSAGHARPNDTNAPLQPEVLGCNVTERNDRINRQRTTITPTRQR